MSVQKLVDILYQPYDESWHEKAESAFQSLWSQGGRYPQRAEKSFSIRAPQIRQGCPFAALIHPDNPRSGPYRGTSFVIFPTHERPALVGLLVGTDGIGPDTEVLGRPGHARKCLALASWINRQFGQYVAWAKDDVTRTHEPVPKAVTTSEAFAPYKEAFEAYGTVMYLLFVAQEDRERTEQCVTAMLDLLFEERSIDVRASWRPSRDELRAGWLGCLFPILSEDEVRQALTHQRFVVIQGPPGTGKTRMALRIAQSDYPGRHSVIQFHPNTSYEAFVGGLAPKAAPTGLVFEPRAGHFLRAVKEAAKDPYLLVIDEINRADLSKVMGEALYLLEPQPETARSLVLEHDYPELGGRTVTMPDHLRILGTMNTADKSIAIVDLAIRRRLTFLEMWPERTVVEATHNALALEAFDRLVDLFVEYASEDSFNLLPGHFYFLGVTERATLHRMRYGLLPLLREYLWQGYVTGFAAELRAYIQWLDHVTS